MPALRLFASRAPNHAASWRLKFGDACPCSFGIGERVLPHLRKVRVTHQLGQLDQLPGVLLQVPRAERPLQVVRLQVGLLDPALSDPGVESTAEGARRDARALVGDRGVGEGGKGAGGDGSVSSGRAGSYANAGRVMATVRQIRAAGACTRQAPRGPAMGAARLRPPTRPGRNGSDRAPARAPTPAATP